MTETPEVALGPSLRVVTVKVTRSPTKVGAVVTTFVTETSDSAGAIALASSSSVGGLLVDSGTVPGVESGSWTLEAVTWA